MIAGAKIAKKTEMHDTDSDSDQPENDHDNHHLSDEEFPMSDDEQVPHSDDDNDHETASKWARTMAKYLKKTADVQILSKATKEADIEQKRKEPKPTYKFEVVGEKPPAEVDDAEQEEKPTDMDMARELIRQRALLKKERQKDILGLRVKPSIKEYEREKALKKIATKGTVQLFNAVRLQQRDICKKLNEAGKLEYKREKVLKNLSKKEFLNVLMNGPRAKSELVDSLVKKEEVKDENMSSDNDEGKSTWGALRADFLTGKKSAWDKEDEPRESFGDGSADASSDSD